MRHGPLLYALSALGGGVSTKAGGTELDSRCLTRIEARQPLPEVCRTLYRRALRSLRVDVVAVVRYPIGLNIRRYRQFFIELLGRPRRFAGADLFDVRSRSGL